MPTQRQLIGRTIAGLLHVIGSRDRIDLALPSPGHGRDIVIMIRVASDGTVKLLAACLDEDYLDGRCAPR